QNRRDVPRDNPLDSVEVLRHDIKRSKSENKRIVPTEMMRARHEQPNKVKCSGFVLKKFLVGSLTVEDDEEESDIDDETRDEELHDKMKSEMEGDECLQNIHDQKVASKVKKTCPLSNSKEDREGSICSGEWVPNGKKLLMISVYAPQELTKKKMLWDYLTLMIDKWNGEVVTMGDFNEVRKQTERYDSIFNVQGANAFNSFISDAGLEEVPLVNEKMKYLKEKIRAWIKVKKDSSKNYKKTLKSELAEIDLLLDKREGNYDVLNKRMSGSKSLQELDKLESMEVAQKAKIKWAIEGDENLKYYHGILNKKRSQFAICGILVDGIWIDSPYLVKNEFLSHFTYRFDQPHVSRLQLDMDFPNKLSRSTG
ncbi:RNA-directed DNA polymerase, eukaryota, reverse transcriptase zinc-binding domain protein, partial [Tanacetum coccineum]